MSDHSGTESEHTIGEAAAKLTNKNSRACPKSKKSKKAKKRKLAAQESIDNNVSPDGQGDVQSHSEANDDNSSPAHSPPPSREPSPPPQLNAVSSDPAIANTLANVSSTLAGFQGVLSNLVRHNTKNDAALDRLNKRMANLEKGRTTVSTSAPPNGGLSVASANVGQGDKVSEATKAKIWADEYVDFADLLDKDRPKYKVTIDPNDTDAAISVEPREKNTMTIQKWRKAFATYQACYLSKFTPPDYTHDQLLSNTQALITYGIRISDMHERGSAWYNYDVEFRKERAITLVAFDFWHDRLNAEAYAEQFRLLTQSSVDRRGGFSPRNSQGSFRNQAVQPRKDIWVPMGFCLSYHKRYQICEEPSCPYSHRCFICRGYHQAHTCNGSRQARQGNNFSRFQPQESRQAQRHAYPSQGFRPREAPRQLRR